MTLMVSQLPETFTAVFSSVIPAPSAQHQPSCPPVIIFAFPFIPSSAARDVRIVPTTVPEGNASDISPTSTPAAWKILSTHFFSTTSKAMVLAAREWLIPKTTVNTVVKELTQAGYITLVGTERSREKNIVLTQEGRTYADQVMKEMKLAERQALDQTLDQYPAEFIDAIEYFAGRLCDAFAERKLL